MEQSLGPSLGAAQERRFISRLSSLTVGGDAVLARIPAVVLPGNNM